MYEIIFRVNNVLNFIDVVDVGNQVVYIVEVKFLRVFVYFKLVRLYGVVFLVMEVVVLIENEKLFIRVSEE